MLLRVMDDDAILLRRELAHRFRQAKTGAGRHSTAEPKGTVRTVAQLRAAHEDWSAEKRSQAETRRATEKAQRDRENAQARVKTS